MLLLHLLYWPLSYIYTDFLQRFPKRWHNTPPPLSRTLNALCSHLLATPTRLGAPPAPKVTLQLRNNDDMRREYKKAPAQHSSMPTLSLSAHTPLCQTQEKQQTHGLCETREAAF